MYTARNFYGVVRVIERSEGGVELRQLMHGSTVHGLQIDSPRGRLIPTAYYSKSSGLAAAIDAARSANSASARPGVHLGAVGMGGGTAAALARAGERVRFYEINPEVVALAQGPDAYFTFIGDSRASVTVVPGDARQSLERELAAGDAQKFDVLAIDAFSGDSVPLHLITREAFRVYAAHLRNETSILAVHVTNRYLDLEPAIAANAHDLGFAGARVDTAGDLPAPAPSSWILLSRQPATVGTLPSNFKSRPLRTEQVLFTDQFSNLFQVIARQGFESR